MSRLRRPGFPASQGCRGSGLLSTAIGLAVVVSMIGLLANVALGLWARTTVDSVAYDAARRVATSYEPGQDPGTRELIESAAKADAVELLGNYGTKVEMTFEQNSHPEDVVLHVEAPGVTLLPRMVGGGPVVAALDRRIVIRKEGR